MIKAILQQDNPVITAGKIELPNQMIISYCSQDTSSLHGTIREYAAENEIDETLFMAVLRKLDFSRIQFEKRIEDYSGGQKKKVLIAASLCQSAHLYLWDEPLNYIDLFSRMQIEQLLLRFRPTLLFVEHDQAFRAKNCRGDCGAVAKAILYFPTKCRMIKGRKFSAPPPRRAEHGNIKEAILWKRRT